MTFPTPSMILYVGSCFPSAVTALKKWGLGVMGDWDVGNRPWLSGKETRGVVDIHLWNMREKVNCVRMRKVRIIWKVDSELASLNLAHLHNGSASCERMRGPAAKRDLRGLTGPEVLSWSHCHISRLNFKFILFFCIVLRSVSAVVCLVSNGSYGTIAPIRSHGLLS